MKVLIVDDEKTIRKGVKALLERSDFPITSLEEAKNGKDAYMIVEGNVPDVIITDIRMPVMDGLELCKTIRENYSTIEMIILSGYEDFSYAKQALQYGVIDYVLKPVTRENLHHAFLKLITKHSFKWVGAMNESEVMVMKESVASLIKGILAENTTEIEIVFHQWRDYCIGQKFSILKIKQLMNAYQFMYKSKMTQHIKDIFKAEQLFISTSPTAEQLFDVCLQYFLQQIQIIQAGRVPRSSYIMQEVLKTIHDYYEQSDLNINLLAKQVDISTPYLSKIFRETMNIPITRYISEYRLERSKEIIESGKEMKNIDICYACGFNDYPYFSKYFKRMYGVSPQEYRESIIYR